MKAGTTIISRTPLWMNIDIERRKENLLYKGLFILWHVKFMWLFFDGRLFAIMIIHTDGLSDLIRISRHYDFVSYKRKWLYVIWIKYRNSMTWNSMFEYVFMNIDVERRIEQHYPLYKRLLILWHGTYMWLFSACPCVRYYNYLNWWSLRFDVNMISLWSCFLQKKLL